MKKDIIEKLRKINPYPDDIFIEPTKKEYKAVKEMFKKYSKKTLDGYVGSISRYVWNLCCDELKKILEEDING